MSGAVAEDLSRICGAAHVRDGEPYRIADRTPALGVRPGSDEEVSRVLAFADAQRMAVVPWGKGVQQTLLASPARYDIALDLGRLDRFLAYEPGDMTATVQAGMPLAALQQVLAGHGQCFPLDPPWADTATVGGAVASLQAGPLRCQYGSARDLVLGVQVAHADGTITKAGSRVVKNATAYDVTKLYVGSFGTLAVLLSMTLRLHPRPAAERGFMVSGGALDALHGFAVQLLGSHLAPSRIELLTAGTACGLSTTEPVIVLSFGGVPEAVADQAETLGRFAGQSRFPVMETAQDAFTRVRDFPGAATETTACWRGGVLASDGGKALEAMRAALPPSVWFAGALTVSHGTIRGICQTQDREALAPALGAARDAIENMGGYLVVSDGPAWLRTGMDVWGTPPAEIDILRSLKHTFDPNGVLNPGRFLGL